uniref:Uncharacterized protein n=1 Tax=Arundo donax TaxID=35708 RepID=A0A0A9DDE6_ARUDO
MHAESLKTVPDSCSGRSSRPASPSRGLSDT